MNEFALIDHYFKALAERAGGPGCDLGIGDDCALVTVPPGQQLAITADTLVAGVHFPRETAPFDIGYKALAVNLSDLASSGARPAWFSLCLTLPQREAAWLDDFCAGLAALMEQVPVRLIGGDTTRGPLSITIQALGWVEKGKALRRDGGRPGDDIYVSGQIGAAGAGLRLVQTPSPWPADDTDGLAPAREAAVQRLNRPAPRNRLGESLVGEASACIDISDGLLADLGHLLDSSGTGATLDLARIPLAELLNTPAGLARLGLNADAARLFALGAGDDYELCFTAPPARRETIAALSARAGVTVTCIGTLTDRPGTLIDTASGQPLPATGYTHF